MSASILIRQAPGQFERIKPRRKVAMRNRGVTWDTSPFCVGQHCRIYRNYKNRGTWALSDDFVWLPDLNGRREAVVVWRRIS